MVDVEQLIEVAGWPSVSLHWTHELMVPFLDDIYFSVRTTLGVTTLGVSWTGQQNQPGFGILPTKHIITFSLAI